VVVVLQDAAQYEDYLVRRLVRGGSTIAPQVGAGIASLTRRKSIPELEEVLEKGPHGPEVFRIDATLAAYATLKILGSPTAQAFLEFPEANRKRCWFMAQYHYNFWRVINFAKCGGSYWRSSVPKCEGFLPTGAINDSPTGNCAISSGLQSARKRIRENRTAKS
jgi:hypothetical protein